jgi:N-acetylglucosaminyldiphosphoundecaprenol N-acetyl-beta-D-mannosaminyltransferase
MDHGKKNLLGILVDAVDCSSAVERVLLAARSARPLAVTALAVHGVMTGYLDPELKYRLNELDLVLPDGQPVRWAMNWLYKTGLRQRVYGPSLMIELCEKASHEGLPVYFYGSTLEVVSKLASSLQTKFPALKIAGSEPSLFRQLTCEEKQDVVKRIRNAGSALVFVGLGCPRQEIWIYEFRDALSIPAISVGAGFPFHAGVLAQAPAWMQRYGLEWLFRLAVEPGRLWRRYLLLNPLYLWLVLLQLLGLKFSTSGRQPQQELTFG